MNKLLSEFKTFPYSLPEIKKCIIENCDINIVRANATYTLFKKDINKTPTFSDLKGLYITESINYKSKADIILKEKGKTFLDLSLTQICYASEKTILQECKYLLFIILTDLLQFDLTPITLPSFGCFLLYKKSTNKDFYIKETSIPNFKPTEILGEGTFGLVLKGVCNKGNLYADKIMKKGIDLNEIDISRRINHPNILHCLNIFKDDLDRLHLIFPLAEYTLDKHTFTSTYEKFNFIYQIASGIHFLHLNNYYHCDIKPKNILIFKNNNGSYYPVISDFGWTFPTSYIQPICGTPGYASPQGWHNHPDIYPYNQPINLLQSDIFSLGAVFYYIFFGSDLIYWKDLKLGYTNISENLITVYKKYKGDKELKEVIELINFMCQPDQQNRLSNINILFDLTYFVDQGWNKPIKGTIINKDINLDCEMSIDNIKISKIVNTGYNFIITISEAIKAPLLTTCIAFSLFCRALEEKIYTDIRSCSIICASSIYIACNLSYIKIDYDSLVKSQKHLFTSEELKHMTFKMVFSFYGILRVKTIYDISTDINVINNYYNKVLQNCKYLNLHYYLTN